ncbi:hypothetical protein ETD86_07300 [Nonomuraea turkmeniaca]|uniref:Uncharacterized protein n=1 Tax=Nonomuraea turkmeniaca TaxID=103838 RepID=A0A5S4FSI4_9ACTN|nr:hypothetical protein [Nonomuraea turkmeniaca]TMR23639.1 hypothetical protein ETD86_07300 [Nonomuraea turkmeniaca]
MMYAPPPADCGRRGLLVPCAGLVAAPLALAPALPRPSGTVRHVPDLVGAVLLASAVAAGVLAKPRGSAWGWLYALGGGGPARPASAIGAISTGVVLGGAIGVTGATVLIGRFLREPAPVHASLLVAFPAAVLLAAAALVRVAEASGRETGLRSQCAAEEEPAVPGRLLAGLRERSDNVRSAAVEQPARFAASDSRVVNPR